MKTFHWLRLNCPATQFSELNRCDLLLLALAPNGPAATYLSNVNGGFSTQISALREKFASESRSKARQLSAINKLALRAFRDGSHRSEMILDFIEDFLALLILAGITDKAKQKEQLCHAFKDFPFVLSLMW